MQTYQVVFKNKLMKCKKLS